MENRPRGRRKAVAVSFRLPEAVDLMRATDPRGYYPRGLPQVDAVYSPDTHAVRESVRWRYVDFAPDARPVHAETRKGRPLISGPHHHRRGILEWIGGVAGPLPDSEH